MGAAEAGLEDVAVPEANGEEHIVRAGEVPAPNHRVVKARPELFEAEPKSTRPVGEVRSRGAPPKAGAVVESGMVIRASTSFPRRRTFGPTVGRLPTLSRESAQGI
jgi:hypothetical protein